MNLPNKLTIVRACMIPFFLYFLYTGNKWVALAIFCIASFTDFLDGYLARKWNLVTNFGKFMDPLADKLLVCSALIAFVDLSKIAGWIVIVIIAREFIISGFRLVASDCGVVIAAGYWGKFKTVTQMALIIVVLADLGGIFNFIETVLLYGSVILTIISLIDYLYVNRNVLTEGNNK